MWKNLKTVGVALLFVAAKSWAAEVTKSTMRKNMSSDNPCTLLVGHNFFLPEQNICGRLSSLNRAGEVA